MDLDKDSGRWSPSVSLLSEESQQTARDEGEVDHLLHLLQVSGEHEELELAFHKLDTLFSLFPRHLEKRQVQTSILSAMAQMESDLLLQEVGLRVLNTLMAKSQTIEDKLKRNPKAFFQVLQLMSQNPKNSQIQGEAVHFLVRLIDSVSIQNGISQMKQWQPLLDLTMAASLLCGRDTDLLLRCLQLVTAILHNNSDIQVYLVENYLTAILHLIKTYTQDTNIMKHLFNILLLVAESDQAQPNLAGPVLTLVADQWTHWHQQDSLVSSCFCLLEKLCSKEKSSSHMTEKKILLRSVLPKVMSATKDPFILLCGLRIFSHADVNTFHHATFDKAAVRWLKVIYEAMHRHLEVPEILVCGCEALSKLMECKPDIYLWIGENSEQKQEPIHTLCLGAIFMFGARDDVFTAACIAIYHLSADNDSLCKLLMSKNSHIAIIQGLATHANLPRAVNAACRAIRGLCIFQPEHKKEVARCEDDLLTLLVNTIKNFPADADVQSEVISTIACLADEGMVRHQCFVVNLHLRVLEAMDSFPGDDFLQEVALEALNVLGGANSGASILNSHGAIDKIIKCMKRFHNNENLQKKGLWAMQILAEWQLVRSAIMCKELVGVIKSTIQNYPRNLIILKEAIVAMQILAEKGVDQHKQDQYSQMAEILMDEGCHELLFQTLEKYEDPGLHDLASECLYVLGIEQDLKSRMLYAACSKGYIAGAECLIEVGADVNMSQGSQTPLYIAVKSKDENMVQLLLRHNVRDVISPLKLSLSQGTHNITGMLLAHIGQDKETGTVLWSNLGLRDVRPEWILPTWCGQTRAHLSSQTSKQFVAKLIHSKLKRSFRHLRPSPSDSKLETVWRIYFHNSAGARQGSPSDHLDKQTDTAVLLEEQMRRNLTVPQVAGNGDLSHTIPPMNGHGNQSHRLLQVSDRRSLGDDSLTSGATDDFFQTEMVITPKFPDSKQQLEVSEVELEDWKRTTLSGANIPYSSADPRRPKDFDISDMELPQLKVKWPRKLSSRETHQLKLTSINNLASGFNNQMMTLTPNIVQPDLQSSDTEASYTSFRGSLLAGLSAEDTDNEVSIDNGPPATPQEHNILNLDISGNHISTLDNLVEGETQVLHSFSRLEHLNLGNNKLTTFPGDVSKALSSLKRLDLNNNNLAEFPWQVRACSRLFSLNLSSNLISALSFENVESMQLHELNISKNKLTTFPIKLDKAYPNLAILNISSNRIQALPAEPCHLTQLRFLDASHNCFHILPDEFLRYSPRLETLIAVNNGLDVLPNESVATGLARLTTLKLSNNDITERDPFFIPKFILALPNVRIVDLSCNGVVGFPQPFLWKTQMLKELMLSRNNISKLNLDGAKTWSKLEKLHLAHNKISEIPKDIGLLSSLQSLDVSYNKQLTSLPDELGRCSRLWEMPLDGLSLDLDIALTRGKVKDLTIYLHNRLKKAQQYYRMKLMVVGYGGKGKTSLLQALKRKLKSNQVGKPPVTVGVIVDDWRYERQRSGKSVTYTLSTWDFAGQEDFYSTHQCFLSNRTLYLVVYDISMGTDEIEKLKPWLANIHARAPGCPVIVVGTHYDLLPDENKESVVAEFESKLKELLCKPGFPIINCFAIVGLNKETREIEQLRNKVKEIVDEFKVKGQPVMGQKVPASYVRLADLLHEEARKIEGGFPVIKHSKLMHLIKFENLDLDEDELKQAVNFLHESGVLLHYNETTLQMKDFYFINPGWLCRMMAQVVTVPEINPFIDRNGVMKRSSVQMLFTGKETSGESHFTFPPTLIPQYLHLLEKFEIALPRNEEELLIPCRLPSRKPNIEMPVCYRTPSPDLVIRYYEMPNTPIGFWSRLLTRLIVFSESKFVENMLDLGEKPQLQYWKEGIWAQWSQTAFFLVDSHKSSQDEIHLTVPSTAHGVRLMGYLVDHIDSLVQEWYPGLATMDPMLGRELLERFAPCTSCPGPQPHKFGFEDLLKESESKTEIFCPEHKGLVDLIRLAPDVMLADVEPHFHLDLDQFDFRERPEYLCGDGGFGSVYKATYKGELVAVKVFNAIGDMHPHKMLRQEATILRRLKHPSVIALVGVSLRPSRLVVMEFAPNKALGDVFKSSYHLSRILQLKMSQQIAEGVGYLHNLMIIYRDLKPDNVLVFSLAPDALINVKIADYGISQFTTLFGLTAQEGTPGYRAPEVIRGETYSFQADIFSLGVLMYMILTGGVHPFEGLDFNSEMDKAIAENFPIPPITKKGCPSWPDFQELISQCLNQLPEYRPKAKEVFERLSSAELLSLREVLPVSVRSTVECMVTQQLDSKNNRLWMASGDNECMQLSWLNLLDYKDHGLHPDRGRASKHFSGTAIRHGRVLCMLPVNKDNILLGTQSGKISVFSAVNNVLKESECLLQDSVLSLFLVQRRVHEPLVLAGLANGNLALYPLSEVMQEKSVKSIQMKLGESYEPIRCIIRSGIEHKIIVSCGTKIIVIDTKQSIAVENRFDTVDRSNNASAPITSIACGRQLYVAHRCSDILESWDYIRNRKKMSFSISENFSLSQKAGRITALVLHEQKILWVGTGGGHIALVDVKNWAPVICVHRHTGSIRCLLAVKLKGAGKSVSSSHSSVILSGGLGFTLRSEGDQDKDNQDGCIGVWDADFPQTFKQLSDWARNRTELNFTSRAE